MLILLSERWVTVVINWVTDYIGKNGEKGKVEKFMQLLYRRLEYLNAQNVMSLWITRIL